MDANKSGESNTATWDFTQEKNIGSDYTKNWSDNFSTKEELHLEVQEEVLMELKSSMRLSKKE